MIYKFKYGNFGLFEDVTLKKQSTCFRKRHTICDKCEVRHILKLFLTKKNGFIFKSRQ